MLVGNVVKFEKKIGVFSFSKNSTLDNKKKLVAKTFKGKFWKNLKHFPIFKELFLVFVNFRQ
jgi:hypothetical protein